MNLTITITQNELLDVLLNIAPVRPVFIWGTPGIGKSALVHRNGDIYINIRKEYSPDAWAYILAHALLHLAFGHFDKAKMPFAEYEKIDLPIWNLACDLFITRFLADIKFPGAIFDEPGNEFSVKLNDETKIYSYLKNLSAYDIAALTKGQNFSTHHSLRMLLQTYGTNSPYALDMSGLEHPIVYKDKQTNTYANAFAYALASSVTQTVSSVSGDNRNSPKDTPITKAAQWFLNHYPLLGGIASSFKIIEDYEICQKYEIHIAAVDAGLGEIYANPAAGLSETEWRFVLAHEYLHAGLEHHKRCNGRDTYLWNVACDFVINGWLKEMQIGMALGTIASYAVSKDVPFVRIVFCDADAYDAGYMAPEEIAGKVRIEGRGGTILQPGVNLLEQAKDFPKDGPILIITDGEIEPKMHIAHTHAFLLPKGRRLPFVAKEEVFYFQ